MKDNWDQTGQLYESILEQSPLAYAYQKIIRDEDGEPIDAVLMEVNQAFEDLVEADGTNIIGKKATEVLPGIREGKLDWIKEFGKVATTGEQREFEGYVESLDQWYKVKAHPPKPDHFAAYYTEITQEMQIAEFSKEFLGKSLGDIDYGNLTDKALDISGAKYGLFNLFDSEGKSFTTEAVSGPRESINKATSLLGFELVGHSWNHQPELINRIKDQSITRFDALHELTGEMAPKPVVKQLEKFLSLGETVVARVERGGRMVGDFTLILPQGEELENPRLIEMYTGQVGSLIERVREEQQRKLNEKRLETAMGAGNLAWWEMELPSGEVEFNERKAEMLGYSGEEFEHYSDFTDLLHPEDHDRAMKAMRDHLEGQKERYEVEYRIQKSEGGYKWFRDVGAVTKQEGEYRKVTGIVIDIDGRKRVEQELKEERINLRQLHEAVDRFQRCDTEEDLCHAAVEATKAVLKFDWCAFYCLEGERLIPASASGAVDVDELTAQGLQEGLVGKTYREKETMVGDEASEASALIDAPEATKSYISVPIGDVGVFHATSSVEKAFDESDREIAEILAGHLNEEVKRIRLEEELREQAVRDPLTGLYNRRYFNETLHKEVERTKRYGKSLAFLMIDVNRFKEINDRYSHQTGDQVLEEVADLLKQNVRSADTVVRYGGDEFLVMMPETNGEIEVTVDRLKNELAAWNRKSDLLDFPLTLAMGISHWDTNQDRGVEEALHEADQKMYEDKAQK